MASHVKAMSAECKLFLGDMSSPLNAFQYCCRGKHDSPVAKEQAHPS